MIWKKWKITRRWCKNGERRLETKKKSKNPFSFFKKSPFIFLATHWKPKYIYESFLNFFPSFRRLKTSKITYLSIFFISLFAEISPVEKTTLRCVCELPNVFFSFFFFQFPDGVTVASIPSQVETDFARLATLFQGTP